MHDLNDLFYFAKVVEAGGFAAAGRTLGIPLLSELVVSFLAAYPTVQLELIQTNRRIDLLNEGVDVALRVRSAEDEDPTLITRRLRPAQAFMVAAPALLDHARVSTPDDLAALPALGALEADRKIHLRLQHDNGRVQEVMLDARLAIEDFNVRKHAAMSGLGFTMLPAPLCLDELADGRLIRLLPDWALPAANLQAVYTHRRGMLPAVRAWIEHISDAFSRWDQPI